MSPADALLRRLSVMYGKPDTSDAKAFLDEYRSVLEGYDERFYAAAGDRIRDEHAFRVWPTPAELRKALRAVAAESASKVDHEAQEAERRKGWSFADLAKGDRAASEAERAALIAALKRDLADRRADEDYTNPNWERGQRPGFKAMQRMSPTGMHRAG